MFGTIPLIIVLASAVLGQASANDEPQIWNLENAYWEYVKADDLGKYRAFWHEGFVGWPNSSSTPLRKNHITDWITRNTSKEIKLQWYAIEQLAIQRSGDIAIDHYRIKMVWAGPGANESKTEVLRITHTWIRARDTFQIIGGMSPPVNAEGKYFGYCLLSGVIEIGTIQLSRFRNPLSAIL